MIETDERFWDCECDSLYIHKKTEKTHCGFCGTHELDQPDSIKEEIEVYWQSESDD